MAIHLLAALAFVTVGFVLILDSNANVADIIAGGLSISFFGLGTFILGRLMLDRRPVLLVNQDGFWDRRVSKYPLPWHMIAHVTPSHMLGLTCFTLTLNQPVSSVPLTWENRFRRILGWPFFPSQPYDLDCTIYGLNVSRQQFQAAVDQAAPLLNGLD